MFVRLLTESFRRQRRRKLIALCAVAIGTGAATALGNLALQVEDNVGRELRRFGANLVILPAGGSGRTFVGGEDITGGRVPAWLDEANLNSVKDNFWRNNILDFAPELDVAATLTPVRPSGAPGVAGGDAGPGAGHRVRLRGGWFDQAWSVEDGTAGRTGWKALSPDWSVAGEWPGDEEHSAGPMPILLGANLAAAIGAAPGRDVHLQVAGRSIPARVTGVLTSGEDVDDMVLAPLRGVQEAAGLSGRLDRVRVSAMTTPETAFAKRLGLDPRSLSAADLEKWTCTPFVTTIAFELARAWPGSEVKPVRRVAETEGRLLTRTGGLMALIALVAAFSASLTVASALTTSVLERRSEIGLFKALGSGTWGVLGVFLAEAAVIGAAGGGIGALLGAVLSLAIRQAVFGSPGEFRPLSVLLSAGAAIAITLAGSALPARRLVRLRAADALRG